MPLVSVLTPSYGYGRFLPDCLESVRRQEGVEVQHIVQDAASTDDTVEVLTAAEGVDWVTEPDKGQSDALNRALRRATGEWIAWLNVDEFYLPGALASLVARATSTGADVVYGETAWVDVDGKLLRVAPQHRFSHKVLREYGCFIASAGILIRRSSLREDPWDVEARRRMDWDLYTTLAEDGASFRHLPRPVSAFRIHPDQVTAAGPEHWLEEDARLSVRHGLSADHAVRRRTGHVGRLGHPVLKALDGGYARQLRARQVAGADLRWFREDVGTEGLQTLLAAAYDR